MPFARVDLYVDHMGLEINGDNNNVLTDDSVLNLNTDEDDLDFVSETSGESEIHVSFADQSDEKFMVYI